MVPNYPVQKHMNIFIAKSADNIWNNRFAKEQGHTNKAWNKAAQALAHDFIVFTMM